MVVLLEGSPIFTEELWSFVRVTIEFLFTWHALSTVGTYIDSGVPFQIMSNQLNLPQVDSSLVVETSQE